MTRNTSAMGEMAAEIIDLHPIEAFTFRWPTETEDFEAGWTYQLKISAQTRNVRHGLGSRLAYGRQRVHTVTWLDGNVEVEGVEADDYPTTQALLSLLRHPNKKLIRTLAEVPTDYDGFEIVDHRREIDAPFSRYSLAVKIREDDFLSWGIHAWLRSLSRQQVPATPSARPRASRPVTLPPAPSADKQAIRDAILAHGRSLAEALGGGTATFTDDEKANRLLYDDPFAFLVGVICDQGVRAERAWATHTS